MFDTIKTGKKIMELRKEHNLTQMELADHMGVSYQAVSNWERGNSMPDISKLPELAVLFKCSVDDILGGSKETDFINKVINEEPMDVENEDTWNLVAETGPMMKPNKTESMLEAVLDKGKEINLKDIVKIAPFVSDEYLDRLIDQANVVEDIQDIVALAPFLSEKTLNKVVVQLEDAGNLDKIVRLAPFLDTKYLDDLVRKTVKKYKENDELVQIKVVNQLAPFLSKACMDDLVDLLDMSTDSKAVVGLAPFISGEALDKLVTKAIDAGDLNSCRGLYPFLGQKTLKKLAEEMIQTDGINGIRDIAPFL